MTPHEKLIAIEAEMSLLEELVKAYEQRLNRKRVEWTGLVRSRDTAPYVDPLEPDGNFPADLEVDCG